MRSQSALDLRLVMRSNPRNRSHAIRVFSPFTTHHNSRAKLAPLLTRLGRLQILSHLQPGKTGHCTGIWHHAGGPLVLHLALNRGLEHCCRASFALVSGGSFLGTDILRTDLQQSVCTFCPADSTSQGSKSSLRSSCWHMPSGNRA